MRFKAAVLERVGAPLVVRRSSYGGARPRRDFPWLAQLYLDGRLKLDELTTRRISLGEINDGFAAMTRGEVVRTVVMF
jgi:S-(hydroxymethyl)glutathione dehydrogenase/alcohol dehydrogenase